MKVLIDNYIDITKFVINTFDVDLSLSWDNNFFIDTQVLNINNNRNVISNMLSNDYNRFAVTIQFNNNLKYCGSISNMTIQDYNQLKLELKPNVDFSKTITDFPISLSGSLHLIISTILDNMGLSYDDSSLRYISGKYKDLLFSFTGSDINLEDFFQSLIKKCGVYCYYFSDYIMFHTIQDYDLSSGIDIRKKDVINIEYDNNKTDLINNVSITYAGGSSIKLDDKLSDSIDFFGLKELEEIDGLSGLVFNNRKTAIDSVLNYYKRYAYLFPILTLELPVKFYSNVRLGDALTYDGSNYYVYGITYSEDGLSIKLDLYGEVQKLK